MGRPPKKPGDVREIKIEVRVSEKENKRYIKAAGKLGVSTWLRNLADRECGLGD